MFGWTNKKKQKQKATTNEERREERRKKTVAPLSDISAKQKQQRERRAPSFFERIALMTAYDIGVDLGTANVLVYVKGKGIVLDEPSYVARNTKTHEVVAVGEDARIMVGRTPEDIEVIRPLQDGVIADYDTTEFMLRYFIKSVLPASVVFRPRIVVCVPSGITPVEKRAVLEAALQAGARKTVLIEEPLAAALGTGLDKARAHGAMVVDVGGGTTDVAVLCSTGVVLSESLRVGGDRFDSAIVDYLRRRSKLFIGTITAESLKVQIGTVDRKAPANETTVRGRDTVTGLPKAVTVTSKDVQRALERPVRTIIEGIKDMLEKTPPELVAEIMDHGIILTGGGAMINGLDRLITRVTGIAAYLVDNPRYSVIMGTGRALREMSHLQDTLEDLQ